MPDITIIQLATPNIDGYALYSAASARHYALTHGYHLQVQRSKTLTDLHINWTKIDILKTVLANAPQGPDSYVILLDADTVIMRPDRTINYFVSKYGKSNTAIYMAADTPFSFSRKKKPNAGFVIVKNDETGRKIIARWIDAAYSDGKKYNDIHPRNQLVYWNCVEPEYAEQQVVLPKRYFHKPLWWVPKPLKQNQFLYHITSSNVDSRTAQMKAFYEQACGDQKNLKETQALLEGTGEGLLSLC
ncbi:hypothetical protein [Marinoscillum sp.]|uniref:hypothetical protein n=1 Tax=Marinoscillum sp. TaxID=2024838 RepID=UPI003BABF47A